MYFDKQKAVEFNKNRKKSKKKVAQFSFSESDKNRLIEMAWQDRVSFDTIKELYGFSENEVKNMMRDLLKRSSFKMWRKRVQGRATKQLDFNNQKSYFQFLEITLIKTQQALF